MTLDTAAQLITSVAAFLAALLGWWNNRKLEEVRHNTNSMKDELVAEVRKSARANGVIQGRAETK